MLAKMLNDLAEAMKALDGKKRATCVSCVEVLDRVVLYARLHELWLLAPSNDVTGTS